MSMSPTRKKLIQNKVADLLKVFYYLEIMMMLERIPLNISVDFI